MQGSEYPDPFKEVVNVFELVTLDFFQVFHVSCVQDTGYDVVLYVSTLVPLGMVVLILLIQAIIVKVVGGKMTRGPAIQFLLIVLFFTLPAISNIVFKAFGCTTFYDGEDTVAFMTADLSLEVKHPPPQTPTI